MKFCKEVVLLTLMCVGLSVINVSASLYGRSPSTTPFPVDKRCDLNEKCVVYYLCTKEQRIIKDAEYLIDERMDVATSNAVMCPSLQRCCGKGDIGDKPRFVPNPEAPQTRPTKPSRPTRTTESHGDSDEPTEEPPTKPTRPTRTPPTKPGGFGSDDTSGDSDEPTEEPPTKPTRPTRTPPTKPDNFDSDEDLEDSPPLMPEQSKCGYRNVKGLVTSNAQKTVKSIQGNTDYSQYGEFPWMVAVLKVKPSGTSWMFVLNSGGSLIHPKVVLTSAHNVAEDEAEDLKVRAGEWNTQSEDELYKYEERNVTSIIRHESFTRQNLQNDLALLVMKSEFPMNALINTVCLPPPDISFDGQRCLVSGWGKDFFGKTGSYQAFLKKVDLPIVSHDKCQTFLRKTRFGPDFELHEGFLCAGGEEGKDACTGDGGSPLMCATKSNPDHYYLAGIVAGSVGCGNKNVPGLYAQVSEYRDWVNQKMRGLKLKTSSYEF